MGLHLEFVVAGPPISNQQNRPAGRANLTAWRSTIATQAATWWPGPALSGPLKAVIINFHDGDKPSVDVDNMSKPILDEMNSLVYADDRQIRQAEFAHVRIDAAFSIVGVSKIIVEALRTGDQFVYVRIEEPVDPYPLPRSAP